MLSEAVENVGSQSQEKMLNPHKPLVNRNEFSIKTEIRKRKNGELKWDKSTGFRFRRTHLGLEWEKRKNYKLIRSRPFISLFDNVHGLQVTPTSSEVQLWGHARNVFLVMGINSQCSCAPLGWNGRGRRGPFLSPRERCSVGWKGCFWWVVTSPTEQPHPSSTGPCERFMCLNIKACRLQHWWVDVYSPLMFQTGCEELLYCMWFMTLPEQGSWIRCYFPRSD